MTLERVFKQRNVFARVGEPRACLRYLYNSIQMGLHFGQIV